MPNQTVAASKLKFFVPIDVEVILGQNKTKCPTEQPNTLGQALGTADRRPHDLPAHLPGANAEVCAAGFAQAGASGQDAPMYLDYIFPRRALTLRTRRTIFRDLNTAYSSAYFLLATVFEYVSEKESGSRNDLNCTRQAHSAMFNVS